MYKSKTEIQEVDGKINSQTSEEPYALNACNQDGGGGRRKNRTTVITVGIHLVTEYFCA